MLVPVLPVVMVLMTDDKVLVWQVIQAGWRLIRFAAVPISWQLAHVLSVWNCVCTAAGCCWGQAVNWRTVCCAVMAVLAVDVGSSLAGGNGINH